MDLIDVYAALSEAVPLESLARIQTRLTRTLVAELHKPLAALDAVLPKEIAPAVRKALFEQVSALLLTACVNALGQARRNIESGAAESPAMASRKPRAANDAQDDERASDAPKDADDLTVIELRQRNRALEAEIADLRADNQQAHRKLETLEEKVGALEKERDDLKAIAEFEPEFNDAPRDATLTVKVNKYALERVQANAKEWGYDVDTYVCRALVIVDDESEPFIGRRVPFAKSAAKLPAPHQRK